MDAWPLVTTLAAATRPGALESLRYGLRRKPAGCTAQLAWLLSGDRAGVYTVAELRSMLRLRWSGRRVNSALQKLVRTGEVRVARLGNPKGYQWIG